jgi:hypothetical protein
MDHILVCCGSEITRYKQTMAGNIGDIWAKTSYFWDETGAKNPPGGGGFDFVPVTLPGGVSKTEGCYSLPVTAPVSESSASAVALATYSR